MAGKFVENYKKRFVNPYNFIPLMESCSRSVPTAEFEDCYTGYFDCRIKLLTPLFIPNTSSSSRLLSEEEKRNEKCKDEKWKGYDFYSYDDWSSEEWEGKGLPLPPQNPAIPGSEIRGALRSVFEAAFNGCMSSVSMDRVLSRRTNKPKKPGILKKINNEWVIIPCKRAMLFIGNKESTIPDEKMGIAVGRYRYNHWKEGQEIWVKFGNDQFTKETRKGSIKIAEVVNQYEVIENSSLTHYNRAKEERRRELRKKGYVKSWLHKGERFAHKHHESVFYDCNESEEALIRVNHSLDIDSLKIILEQYRDLGKNRNIGRDGKWYDGYEVFERGTLVYYSEVEDHVYLSPACLGREVFTKTVGTLLKENGGYDPCADEKLCPACQVFGMVGKSGKGKTYARASKVRVTDAVLIDPARDGGALFEEPVVLPELGEPKPGTVEFYTEPPYGPSEKWKKGQGFWTYDYKYKVQNNKNPQNMRILSVRELKLRGRKYYWHSQVDLEQYRGNQLSAMKQRIRPMKAVGRDEEPLFRFRVYFERLNRTQLNQLKWAIDFGNPACAHKIGRAKPLGFGSVRLSIDNLYLREIDKGTGIWEMKRETNIENFFSHPVEASEALKIVQKMANWEERPRNVQYPSVDPGSHGTPYKKNETASHQWFKENKKDGYFMKVLPKADEDARKNLESEKALYTYTRNKN